MFSVFLPSWNLFNSGLGAPLPCMALVFVPEVGLACHWIPIRQSPVQSRFRTFPRSCRPHSTTPLGSRGRHRYFIALAFCLWLCWLTSSFHSHSHPLRSPSTTAVASSSSPSRQPKIRLCCSLLIFVCIRASFLAQLFFFTSSLAISYTVRL